MAPSNFPLMQGFEALKVYIRTYFEVAIPELIDVAREQWPGVDEDRLPYPTRYDADDPTLTNDFPTIGFVAVNDRGHIRTDILDTAEQEYWSIFSIRIFLIVRSPMDADGEFIGEPRSEAIKMRNNLTRIIHAALLSTPSMGQPDFVRFDENTMATDYMEAMMPNTQSKRWIASSVISGEFKLREHTHLTQFGVANIVTTEIEAKETW